MKGILKKAAFALTAAVMMMTYTSAFADTFNTNGAVIYTNSSFNVNGSMYIDGDVYLANTSIRHPLNNSEYYRLTGDYIVSQGNDIYVDNNTRKPENFTYNKIRKDAKGYNAVQTALPKRPENLPVVAKVPTDISSSMKTTGWQTLKGTYNIDTTNGDVVLSMEQVGGLNNVEFNVTGDNTFYFFVNYSIDFTNFKCNSPNNNVILASNHSIQIGSNVDAGATFMAKENINLNATMVNPNFNLVAVENGIAVQNNQKINGAIYAPKGVINLNSQKFEIKGWMASEQFSAINVNASYVPVKLPIFEYDDEQTTEASTETSTEAPAEETTIADGSNVSGYKPGIYAEYFDSAVLDNETAIRIKRIDDKVAVNYGYDLTAGPQIDLETFGMKWQGFVAPQVSGEYVFKTYSDDGVKVNFNGETIIDKWGLVNLEYTIASKSIYLEAGKFYPIEIEYQQLPLYSTIVLFWESDAVGGQQIVPESVFFVTEETWNAYHEQKDVNTLAKNGTGLSAEFFDGAEGLNEGRAADYTLDNVMINFELGESAPSDILGDAYSARFTGYIEGKYTEEINLDFIVDDSLKVWVDDQLIIDEWSNHSNDTVTGSFMSKVGEKHKIVIEYNDLGGGSTCVMRWSGHSQELEIVPQKYLYN